MAEDITNIRNNEYFDEIIFNASLHHCDSPIKALESAYSVLRPGGGLWLVNESFLRPWVSEQMYQNMLISDPVKMGHYGGNEHAYHNYKYERLLEDAGFNTVNRISLQPLNVLDRIEYILKFKINSKRKYENISSILSRLIYYSIEQKINDNYKLFNILSGFSLIHCAFHAVK